MRARDRTDRQDESGEQCDPPVKWASARREDDNAPAHPQAEARRTDYADLTDRQLIEHMRREEPEALQEFFERFQPLLLRYARSLGVQSALREQVVLGCLDDVALVLMRHLTPIPRSLAAYLIRALRHDVLGERRGTGRRAARDEAALALRGAMTERVVLEVCSEESVRASAGPDWEAAALSPALERLASALDEGLTDEERCVLGWLGQWVPQALVADWLGISYGALRVRVSRLRDRLREAALRYAGQLPPEDRAVLQEFFRRTALTPRVSDWLLAGVAPKRGHASLPRAGDEEGRSHREEGPR